MGRSSTVYNVRDAIFKLFKLLCLLRAGVSDSKYTVGPKFSNLGRSRGPTLTVIEKRSSTG